MQLCDKSVRMNVMRLIMLPLFHPHSNEQLVFLSEEEKVAFSQFNPCHEQCHTGLLDKLLSDDISTVYRLGKKHRSPSVWEVPYSVYVKHI